MARKTTVYFLEARQTHADGSASDLQSGFWPMLHKHLAALSTGRRYFTSNGLRYGGAAKSEVSPAVDYLYLGKRRRRSDFPDHSPSASGDDEGVLDLPGDLVEPMYVLPVSGTNYAAFLRTSSGPSFEAFEKWVAHVLNLKDTGELFELHPYVREDAMQRLHDSVGVSKFHLKFDPGALSAVDGENKIGAALKRVEAISGGGGVSIEVGVSFGHSRPTEEGAEAYARELAKVVGAHGLTHASATLLTPKAVTVNGRPSGFNRDHVNFLRDQVVHNVELGDSEDERRTSPLVLKAMADAITDFRKEAGL